MNEARQHPDLRPAPVNALVLGGGGPAGVSWMSAFLDGLASLGLSVNGFDVVMGTSAGAVAGAWLTMQPQSLPLVPERMRERAITHLDAVRDGKVDKSLMQRALNRSAQGRESTLEIAQAAVAAISPVSAGEAESAWRAALPAGAWPRQFKVTAVNAHTGLATVWSARDGIPLAVAVASSTTAPGVAPPVHVAGSVWVDGGVRSTTNADMLAESAGNDDQERAGYATGSGKVVILAPRPTNNLALEEKLLGERGHRVRVITAEPFYKTPADLLDPRVIDMAAATGSSQARDLAAELKAWLSP